MSDPLSNEQPTPGLYERLITLGLRERIDAWKEEGWKISEVPADEKTSNRVLARYIGEAIEHHLDSMTPGERVLTVNIILNELAKLELPQQRLEHVAEGPSRLASVARLGEKDMAPHPVTPMGETGLLTNSPTDPKLAHELAAEIPTADGIDLLCAFVRWSGLRLLKTQLESAVERQVPIRVLTTTYIGATEKKAIDRLVHDFGATVKINYETASTRLHAKSWLFRRNTGYDTAYVGSSNLSNAALLDGLEWNVRLSTVANPEAMAKFENAFESYWGDKRFETYDPNRDGERLRAALQHARGSSAGPRAIAVSGSWKYQPRPHQRDMLERLAVERQIHGRTRNLLVSATGTGKTVMAALDYKRLYEQAGKPLRLLFVAHRREILTQSRDTYRDVLNKPGFGESYHSGEIPDRWNHVFASIQALQNGALDRLAPDHFDVLVIDEFHHASAKTYRELLARLEPQQLLGLTATPERMDGQHVQDEYFSGRIAAELRLWEAMDNDLLSPFHYFGVADGTDMRHIRWNGGSYDAKQLDALYTGNTDRADLVVREVEDKVSDPTTMRALGFCVSIDHAEFMARHFSANNIKAEALSSKHSSQRDRESALGKLKTGQLQALFSVDLFNEGLDLPDVDTLLFLRPTESLTVFLQQFGRGLRRTADKEVLTVLDFIGMHRADYPFESRLHALTNLTRDRLVHGIGRDFPHLPAGSQIILDRKSKEIVLDNIRTRLALTVDQLAQEVRRYGITDLATYLKESGREIKELYRNNHSWTELLRRARLLAPEGPAGEKPLLKRLSALLHVDDPKRAAAYKLLLEEDAPSYDELNDKDKAYARMLYFSLWPTGDKGGSYQEGLGALREQTAFREEARQVLDCVRDGIDHLPIQLSGRHADLPLFIHSSYSREEILSALRQVELGGFAPAYFNGGVRWCANLGVDALLSTLEKKEKDFTPGTRYKDYAINSTRFHSESQNSASENTSTGRRYINHRTDGSDVFLFVRRYKETDIGTAHPWVFLGPVNYVSHDGNKPMGITWELEEEMPADIVAYSSAPTTT